MDCQPPAVRRQVLAGRVAYLEGEVAELEHRMALLKRELTVRTWELGEAIIEQAALEREARPWSEAQVAAAVGPLSPRR